MINKSMIKIKAGLMKDIKDGKIKMTGSGQKNAFYQLADFMPRAYELMAEEGVNDIFKIHKGKIILEFVNGEGQKTTTILPYHQYETPSYGGGKKSMQDIQYQGALYTYNRRYAYSIALGIPNNEVIDTMEAEGKTEQEMINEAAAEFKIAAINRGLDPKSIAKRLGLKGSSSKEEWLIATSRLDNIKNEIDNWQN